jgi:hypothetical protein
MIVVLLLSPVSAFPVGNAPHSKVVGPALLLGPVGLIVAQGVGLELRLVRVDNLAAAVLALEINRSC